MLAYETPDTGDNPRIVLDFEERPIRLVLLFELGKHFISVRHHRSELPHAEQAEGSVLAQPAHTNLRVERARAGTLDADDCGEHGARDEKQHDGCPRSHDVERPLGESEPVPR